jgi:hypothetical protein
MPNKNQLLSSYCGLSSDFAVFLMLPVHFPGDLAGTADLLLQVCLRQACSWFDDWNDKKDFLLIGGILGKSALLFKMRLGIVVIGTCSLGVFKGGCHFLIIKLFESVYAQKLLKIFRSVTFGNTFCAIVSVHQLNILC